MSKSYVLSRAQVEKLKKLSPDEWESSANRLARNFAPSIFACRKCSYPVLYGYCCQTCHTASPETTFEQDAMLDA